MTFVMERSPRVCLPTGSPITWTRNDTYNFIGGLHHEVVYQHGLHFRGRRLIGCEDEYVSDVYGRFFYVWMNGGDLRDRGNFYADQMRLMVNQFLYQILAPRIVLETN